MNIELIATDIDGTLIRKDHSISKLTKDTLKNSFGNGESLFFYKKNYRNVRL